MLCFLSSIETDQTVNLSQALRNSNSEKKERGEKTQKKDPEGGEGNAGRGGG